MAVPVLEMPRKLEHKHHMTIIRHPPLQTILQRIEQAAISAGRNASEIILVAVSKTFAADDILPVIQAGQVNFGENRVQETVAKWPALISQHPHIKLHLIGPLQTNKAAEAVRYFHTIHTIDRTSVARVIALETAKQEKQPDLFIQVNTGDEAQKSGIAVDEADRFIEECRNTHKLLIAGLMCIPPLQEPAEKHFDLLAQIAKRNSLRKLSMGMSGDFELAIQYGATHVRVGSAIFGTR